MPPVAVSLRQTFRRAVRHPLSTFVSLIVVAAGVAAFCTILTVIDLVIFRPLTFPDSERLVAIYAVTPGVRTTASDDRWNRGAVSWAGWHSLQGAGAFEEVGAWARARPVLGDPATDTVEAWFVSSSLLRVLGAQAALGQLFGTDDDERITLAVLLSYDCWIRRYGGKNDVIGQTVVLSSFVSSPQAYTIAGVLRPGFRLRGEAPEFLWPIGNYRRSASYDNRPSVYVVGRLKKGVAVDNAAAVAGKLVPASLNQSLPTTARIVPLREEIVGRTAPPTWLLAGTAVVLLLMTCTSVAGISLSEAQARRRETGLRIALGATRRAIATQLGMEHLSKIVIAAACGLSVAIALHPVITASAPYELTGGTLPPLNLVALTAGLGVVVATSLACGVLPALLVGASNPTELGSESTKLITSRQVRIQKVVAAAQLALAFVLVVAATLLGETLARLTARPLGFDPSSLAVLTVRVTAFPQLQRVEHELPLFSSWIHIEEMLENIRRLPGVAEAAGVYDAPFTGGWHSGRVWVDQGRTIENEVQVQLVTVGYFRTMGIQLLAGRNFQTKDRQTSIEQVELPVMVSRSLDQLLGGNSIGRSFQNVLPSTRRHTVIGIVEDVRQRDLDDEGLATFYLLNSSYAGINNLVIRTSTATGPLMGAITEAVRNHDPATIVTRSTTMELLVADILAGQRFRARLSGVLGAAALVLALLGAYALGLRIANDRRRDIAIRLALGATAGQVHRLVLRDAAHVVSLALAAGVPAALLTSHALRGYLFGVSPTAAHVFIISALALSAVTVLALLVPAWRSAVDPALELKS